MTAVEEYLMLVKQYERWVCVKHKPESHYEQMIVDFYARELRKRLAMKHNVSEESILEGVKDVVSQQPTE